MSGGGGKYLKVNSKKCCLGGVMYGTPGGNKVKANDEELTKSGGIRNSRAKDLKTVS